MTTLPFQATELSHLSLAANQTLNLGRNLQIMGHALATLPKVESVALWLPATHGALRLALQFGAGRPLAVWHQGHPLRREFGRRPFLLGDGPAYQGLGLPGATVAVFDLGTGIYCGLGLGFAHDGSAGGAVKALRPVMTAWSAALKACRAHQALQSALGLQKAA